MCASALTLTEKGSLPPTWCTRKFACLVPAGESWYDTHEGLLMLGDEDCVVGEVDSVRRRRRRPHTNMADDRRPDTF